ncbi:MAG: hypothetical protein QF473_09995 [Planctomycetota bacterium]|jgi:K+-transporting ATPase A subunit|nr:hypothetical protein [Planctomycetota bacterium]
MAGKGKQSKENPKPISTLNWMLTIFVVSIPIVNIPFCLYWAFVPWVNPNKQNFCTALFFLFILGVVCLAVLAISGNTEVSQLSALVQSLASESGE